jgi:hypothetical protein
MRRNALAAFSPVEPGYLQPDRRDDYLSVALPRPAEACFSLFCDAERIPEWLNTVRYSVITERDRQGRARRVSFMASLKRASIGYSLRYRYRREELRVAWATSDTSSMRIRGFAQFQALGEKACLMTYCLDVDLGQVLPAFEDDSFQAHAASATLNDFRDFVLRTI